MMKIFFLCFASVVLTINAKVRYDNYTLFRITPTTTKHIEILQSLQTYEDKYDFWTDPVPNAEFVNILTNPKSKQELETLLGQNDVKYEIALPNIQETIDKLDANNYTRTSLRSITFDNYYDLEDIYSWLEDMAVRYDFVTLLIGGSTHEGRDIKGIKISHGTGKRAIFVEGGIHAREWISPATVCFITNKLLTSTSDDIVAAANDFDWYIFPVTNPDGYVHSRTVDIMWRKNRQQFGANYGVDLNRNWNSNWLVAGASTNPASQTYAGPGPFSEPESRTLSEFLLPIGHTLDMYLSFHSYGHLLLIPYGNSTEPYANYHEAMNIGRRAMGALSVRYGTRYVTGNVAEAIYLATGSSTDWVKDHLQVPLVYCYELRDTGYHGFLLPPEQIIPNGLETMDSVLELIYQARRFGVISGNGNIAQVSFVSFGLMLFVKLLL